MFEDLFKAGAFVCFTGGAIAVCAVIGGYKVIKYLTKQPEKKDIKS
jgi:hypothetical protein